MVSKIRSLFILFSRAQYILAGNLFLKIFESERNALFVVSKIFELSVSSIFRLLDPVNDSLVPLMKVDFVEFLNKLLFKSNSQIPMY